MSISFIGLPSFSRFSTHRGPPSSIHAPASPFAQSNTHPSWLQCLGTHSVWSSPSLHPSPRPPCYITLRLCLLIHTCRVPPLIHEAVLQEGYLALPLERPSHLLAHHLESFSRNLLSRIQGGPDCRVGSVGGAEGGRQGGGWEGRGGFRSGRREGVVEAAAEKDLLLLFLGHALERHDG